jgi:hypothetical protein
MGSLLSAISGQFAKAIALGTMFPVFVLTVLNIVLVAPLLPDPGSLQTLFRKIATGEEKWGAVALLFVVLVMTGLLYNLNIPIIRLYEGYSWEASVIGAGIRKLKKQRLKRIETLHASLQNLVNRLSQASPDHSLVPQLRAEKGALAQVLNNQLPKEQWLLPTRLGNIIRSFETYSSLAYGMDAIVLWPRLIAKIDPSFASTIDEAKTSFDFMLNVSFLSAFTALEIAAIFVIHPMTLSWGSLLPYFWRAAIFIALALLFYEFAVNRAAAWGETVRAAFDLYRLDLLKVLGYEEKPLTYQEERAMWLDISEQALYPKSRNAPLSFERKTTRLVPWPSDIQIESYREIGKPEINLSLPVSIYVTNKDAAHAITLLRVIDPIPDGYKYVPDSLSIDPPPPQPPIVSRLAPFECLTAPIGPNGSITITYKVKPVSP